jgi:putative transposase
VGYIAVFHPDLKEFFDVPAVNQEYADGVNRYIHELVCSVTNQRFGDESTVDHLLLVKAEVQDIVDKAVQSHKKASRKKAAVFNLSDSEQILYPKSDEPFTAARKSVDPTLKPDEPLDPGMDDDLPDYATSKRVPETV